MLVWRIYVPVKCSLPQERKAHLIPIYAHFIYWRWYTPGDRFRYSSYVHNSWFYSYRIHEHKTRTHTAKKSYCMLKMPSIVERTNQHWKAGHIYKMAPRDVLPDVSWKSPGPSLVRCCWLVLLWIMMGQWLIWYSRLFVENESCCCTWVMIDL